MDQPKGSPPQDMQSFTMKEKNKYKRKTPTLNSLYINFSQLKNILIKALLEFYENP